jgi:serine/threonine protein kinase
MVGTFIGQYKLVRLLGQGGMGAVYEAVHQKLKTQVAIKLLHREHASKSSQLARFFNEARAVNVIGHPALVPISNVGQLPDGSAYLIMEYLDGETLSQHLKRCPTGMPEVEALRITWHLASALEAAHAKNIVHRDLKPGNVMLVHDAGAGASVRLLDFGIAKLTGLDSDQPSTSTGTLLGTYFYMSPEQCRGSKVDGKTDVYSLGAMLYELISGSRPYNAETPIGVATMHISEPVPRLLDVAPQASAAVSQLIFGMMSKDKNARPSITEVLTLLNQMNPDLATAVPSLPPPRALATETEPDPPTTRGSSTGQAIAGAQPTRRRNARLVVGGILVSLGALGIWASQALRPATDTGAALPKDPGYPGAQPAAAAPAATSPQSPSAQTGSQKPPEPAEALVDASRSARGSVRGKAAKKRELGAKKKPAENKGPAAKPVKTTIID